MTGAERIAEERRRQTWRWSPEHDAKHDSGELVLAARCYAEAATAPMPPSKPPTNWPWDEARWKPSADPIRNLEKAGALMAAEIDRLQATHIDGGGADG